MDIEYVKDMGNDETKIDSQALLAKLQSQLEKNEIQWIADNELFTDYDSTDSTQLELSEVQSTISRNSILVIPDVVSREAATILDTVRSILHTTSEESIYVHIKALVSTLLRFLEAQESIQQEEHDVKRFISLCYLIYTLWLTSNNVEAGTICNQSEKNEGMLDGLSTIHNHANESNDSSKKCSEDHYEMSENEIDLLDTDYAKHRGKKNICNQRKKTFLNNDLYSDISLYKSLIECLRLSTTAYNDYLLEENSFSKASSFVVLGILCLLRAVEYAHVPLPTVQRVPRRLCLEELLVCIASPSKILAKEVVQTLERLYFTYQMEPGYTSMYTECITQIMCKHHSWFSHTKNILPSSTVRTNGNCHYISNNNIATNIKKKTTKRKSENTAYQYFFKLLKKLVHYFPLDFRCKLFVDHLFKSILQASRLTIMNSEAYAMQVAVLKLAMTYFDNVSTHLTSSVNKALCFPIDSLWKIQCKILTALLFQQTPVQVNPERHTIHIKAVFNGLISLLNIMIGNSDDLRNTPVSASQTTSDALLEMSSKLSTFTSIIRFIVHDKKSFIRAVSHSTDSKIQTELVHGWERVCSLTSEISLFWYPAVLPFWGSLLDKTQHKPLWKFLFQCITHLLTSAQNAIINAYDVFGTQQFSVVMSSYVATYSGMFDDNEESSSPAEVQKILDKMTVSLAKAHHRSFGFWYNTFSKFLYDHMFYNVVQRLAVILRETEEPSDETLCLLGKTISEELCISQLKSQDAAVYRFEVQQCVAECFRLFGSQTMLGLESFSLSKILSTPLTCQSFAYTSNAWLIPFMSQSVKRDNVKFFQSSLLPLTKSLLERVRNRLGSTDAVELIETRHYKRLVEQFWALLPSYFRDPLDGPEFLLSLNSVDGENLLEIMLNQLDVPIVQRHICTAFSNLCRSIVSASDKRLISVSFSARIWRCNSSVFNFPSVTEILKQHATKCMGLLVVRYIQLHKTNFTNKTQAYAKSKTSARTAQVILQTLEDIVTVCDTQIVERNLQNLNSVWNESLLHACSLLVKTKKEDTLYTFNENSVFLGTECGAIVDVVNALIPKVSISFRSDLFDKFINLLQNCCKGLKTCFETREYSNNTKSSFKGKILHISEKKNAEEMLGCLLVKAYKGLRNILELSDMIEISSPEKTIEAWQIIILEGRDVSLQIALKPRVAFIAVFIRYIQRNFTNFNELDQQRIFHELISELLPETILNLIEPNSVVRQAAIDILKAISEYFDDVQNVVKTLLPGFGADNSLMKSATLQAISHLVLSYGDRLSLDFIKELFNIVVLNLNDKSQPQVFIYTITCLRVLQRYVPTEELPDIVHKYSEPLLRSPFAASCRMSIRYLLDKALKRAGYFALQQVFPQEHLPLLNYIEKSLRRRIKKATRRRNQLKEMGCESALRKFKTDQDDEQDEEILEDNYDYVENISIKASKDNPSIKCLFDAFNESVDSDTPQESTQSTVMSSCHNQQKQLVSKAKRRYHEEEAKEFCLIENHKDANYDLMSKDITKSVFLARPASLNNKRYKKKSYQHNNTENNNTSSCKEQAVSCSLLTSSSAEAKPSGSNPFVSANTQMVNEGYQKLSLDYLKLKRQVFKKSAAAAAAGAGAEPFKITKRFDCLTRRANEKVIRQNKAQGDAPCKKGSSSVQPYSYIRFQPKLAKNPKEAASFFRSTLLFSKQKKCTKRKR